MPISSSSVTRVRWLIASEASALSPSCCKHSRDFVTDSTLAPMSTFAPNHGSARQRRTGRRQSRSATPHSANSWDGERKRKDRRTKEGEMQLQNMFIVVGHFATWSLPSPSLGMGMGIMGKPITTRAQRPCDCGRTKYRIVALRNLKRKHCRVQKIMFQE